MAKKTLGIRDLPYTREVDGKYYVCVTYKAENGKTRQKYRRVNSVDEALRVTEQLKREYQERGPGAWDGERMRWEDLVAEFRRQDEKTPRWYFDPLDFFNGRLIRSITYGDCKRFKEAREVVPKRVYKVPTNQKRSPATINRELEVLRKVFIYACQHGWLLRNPMKCGKPLIVGALEERRDRLPTLEEEALILAACIGPREHLRSFILATRDTGLRRSALQALTWEMVNWEARVVKVPKNTNRFKNRPKVVGLSDRLYVELRRIFDTKQPEASARIFPIGDYGRGYETACRLAGVEGLRLNDWRHGFATDLMEAGVPQHLAMKAAGHSSAEIHAIYTNIDARLASDVAEKLTQLHRSRAGLSPEPELTTELVQ